MQRLSFSVLSLSLLLTACGPRISQEQYISAMSELGCHLQSESTEGGNEVLKKLGISSEDIAEFRKKTKVNAMMEAATTIAQNVAKCAGISP